jgi:hypothetical protein
MDNRRQFCIFDAVGILQPVCNKGGPKVKDNRTYGEHLREFQKHLDRLKAEVKKELPEIKGDLIAVALILLICLCFLWVGLVLWG